MYVILSSLPYFVKTKVGQCSSAKHLCEKLQNLYLKKHEDQYEDDDNDYDSNRGLFMEPNDDEE